MPWAAPIGRAALAVQLPHKVEKVLVVRRRGGVALRLLLGQSGLLLLKHMLLLLQLLLLLLEHGTTLVRALQFAPGSMFDV